ncbi:trypsin-like peptidase domain-containing protein [Patescibacteria group bacterium]|nr:trypsin-like peptidase domain-containing protein [Patescibacteria group bacterium]
MPRYIPDDNLSYPVLVKVGDGSSGSGFYFNDLNNNQYLITAMHVLYNYDKQKEECEPELKNNKMSLVSYDQNLVNPQVVDVDISLLNPKYDKKNDVVVLKIANLESNSDSGYSISYLDGVSSNGGAKTVMVRKDNLKKYEDTLISNEVFILGYPKSLQDTNQIDESRPLLRKGIVAGKNKERKTIIIDCPVYFGNSGGLVLEVDEGPGFSRTFSVIGVVVEYIPFVERLKSIKRNEIVSVRYENSGYSVVVSTDIILELLEE